MSMSDIPWDTRKFNGENLIRWAFITDNISCKDSQEQWISSLYYIWYLGLSVYKEYRIYSAATLDRNSNFMCIAYDK